MVRLMGKVAPILCAVDLGDMKTTSPFIALKSGTIINLGTVAWIDVGERSMLAPTETLNIIITFAALIGSVGDIQETMDMPLEGKVAEEFLTELENRAIDVTHLRKARAPLDAEMVKHLGRLAEARDE